MLFWSNNDVAQWENSIKEPKPNAASKEDWQRELDDMQRKQELADLGYMKEYAASTNCRRYVMMKYFGQNYDPLVCQQNIISICDNCLRQLTSV